MLDVSCTEGYQTDMEIVKVSYHIWSPSELALHRKEDARIEVVVVLKCHTLKQFH